MKNIKQIIIAVTLSIGIIILPTAASAETYTVKPGDTLWEISNAFGVSLLGIQAANDHTGSLIYPNQTLTIPKTITSPEKNLMARLVHAEAKGEPYEGKVAVATVILNRVDHKEFPNTVKEVIYEQVNGHHAFTPVKNGTINHPADAEAVRAVNEALAFSGQGTGSLYFYNPKTAQSEWIFSRQVTVTIGNHRFAK